MNITSIAVPLPITLQLANEQRYFLSPDRTKKSTPPANIIAREVLPH